MSEHTPGEWHVRPNNGGRFTLLEQQSSDPSSPEARANARLIAAAPELLELAKAVMKAYETEKAHGGEEAYFEDLARLAESAIQKAEGEQ